LDALTAILYPAYTKHCDACGGFMVTTPRETLKRHAAAASEPLAKFAQELESDFVGQFENLISQSLIDRVQRYRDAVSHVAAGDPGAATVSAQERAWAEREAQRAREFAALAVRYYQSHLDLQSEYAHRLLAGLAADVEKSQDEPPPGDAPRRAQTPPAAQSSAAQESSMAQESSAVPRSRPSAKKPPDSAQ
jgi:hypothetical protein